VGLLRHGGGDERVELARGARDDRRQARRILEPDLGDQAHDVVGAIGSLAGDQLEQHDAEREEVGRRRDCTPTEDLLR
jgi:hypothetical protein